MHTTSKITFMTALAAGLSFNALYASTQAGGKSFTPLDVVNGLLHKGKKLHGQGGQQAPAAAPTGDVDDLDALMDGGNGLSSNAAGEGADALEGGAAGGESLELEPDEVTQASESHPSKKAEGQKKGSKTKKKKGAVQGSKQDNNKAKKTKRGKNVPIIITIEPSGDVRLEVPNAHIVEGRS